MCATVWLQKEDSVLRNKRDGQTALVILTVYMLSDLEPDRGRSISHADQLLTLGTEKLIRQWHRSCEGRDNAKHK